MARTKGGPRAHARHKKVLKATKGFRQRSNNCFKSAIQRLEKSWEYAYRDRRTRKRDFRKLWITRINAAARELDFSYAKLIDGLNKAGVEVDRKIMADLAVRDPESFKALVEQARKALEKQALENKAA